MNCFMGYNPLVSKQVKVTVWVCEQDGAIPVAPINPSEGDCFIVYATDEAELANSPTSKKTYSSGSWADAEGGGSSGGDSDFSIAEVTVINNSNANIECSSIGVNEDGLISLFTVVAKETEKINILLYSDIASDFAVLESGNDLTYVVTGDVDDDGEALGRHLFLVSGDGTITINTK